MHITYTQLKSPQHFRNQDALFHGRAVVQMAHKKTDSYQCDDSSIIIGIADGASTSPKSHMASHYWMQALLTCQALDAAWVRMTYERYCEALLPSCPDAITTFIGAQIWADGRAVIVNVGDSMAYHIDSHGQWRLASQCHRYSETLSDKKAADLPLASSYHALTEYLVVTDSDDGRDFHVASTELKLKSDEYLLLCSDGATDGISLAECQQIWQKYRERSLTVLKNKHKALGCHDDLSMVLVGNTKE